MKIALVVVCIVTISYALEKHPPTDSVKILSDSKVFAVAGGSIKLHCDRHYRMNATEWILPQNSTALKDNRAITTNEIHVVMDSLRFHYLQIAKLRLSDSGQYECRLRDNTTVRDVVTVYVQGANEIPPQPQIVFNEYAYYFGDNLTITCYTDSQYALKWILPEKSTAERTNRLQVSALVTAHQLQSTITISHITANENGRYSCVSGNDLNERTNNSTLVVDSIFVKQGVYLNHHAFARPGHPANIKCTIASPDVYDISWYHNECRLKPDAEFPANGCSEWHRVPAEQFDEETAENFQYSTLKLTLSVPGQVKCAATDKDGNVAFSGTAFVYVQEDDRELAIETVPVQVFGGNATAIRCAASKYLFRENSLQLYREDEIGTGVEESGANDLIVTDSDFMYGRTWKFASVSPDDASVYKCVAVNSGGQIHEEQITLVVNAAPRISDAAGFRTASTEDVEGTMATPVTLDCPATAFPTPEVQWFKNKQPIRLTGDSYIKTNSTHLTIARPIEEDAATYECVVANEFGQAIKQFNVIISGCGISKHYFVLTWLLAAMLVVLAVALAFVYRRANCSDHEICEESLTRLKHRKSTENVH